MQCSIANWECHRRGSVHRHYRHSSLGDWHCVCIEVRANIYKTEWNSSLFYYIWASLIVCATMCPANAKSREACRAGSLANDKSRECLPGRCLANAKPREGLPSHLTCIEKKQPHAPIANPVCNPVCDQSPSLRDRVWFAFLFFVTPKSLDPLLSSSSYCWPEQNCSSQIALFAETGPK